MAKKPETTFKERVTRDLDKLPNCWYVKVQQRTLCGTPDLLVCISGYFIALELKREEKADITKLQIYELEKIKQSGGSAYVAWPENWSEIFKVLKVFSTDL